MFNAVLIDDEKNALEVLEMQLARHCKEVNVVAACQGGEKGIEAIKKFKPEVVFLDIEMPHVNGFDVIKATEAYDYEVIFTTAYDQFAIRAFKYSALDYLLKPIDVDELQAAVARLKNKERASDLEQKIQVLFQQLEVQPRLTDKIALPLGDAMQFVAPNEIIRCESDSNYTHIFMTNGKKITIAKTLKEVEENINGGPFFRIHQSHLVNINHISKYLKGENAYVIMNDGTQIGISRNKKLAFLETFRKI
jgi:two-component system, LytTR family, response regulator